MRFHVLFCTLTNPLVASVLVHSTSISFSSLLFVIIVANMMQLSVNSKLRFSFVPRFINKSNSDLLRRRIALAVWFQNWWLFLCIGQSITFLFFFCFFFASLFSSSKRAERFFLSSVIVKSNHSADWCWSAETQVLLVDAF